MSIARHQHWEGDDEAPGRFQAELGAGLLGRTIETVTYVDLRYVGDDDRQVEPASEDGDFDSVDFGVEVQLDDGAAWSIGWEADLGVETLWMGKGQQIGPDNASLARWDVSDRWQRHGARRRRLEAIDSVWFRASADGMPIGGGRRESVLCIGTIVLRMAGGAEVVLTAGERDASGGFVKHPTNIAVFYSVAAARAAGVFLAGAEHAIPGPSIRIADIPAADPPGGHAA